MADFLEKNQIPQYWINKSTDLKGSAGAIWLGIKNKLNLEELGFGKGFNIEFAGFNTFIMLFGLSLELLLKGIIIERGGIPKNIHNLRSLSENAKITYNPDELIILDLLSEWTVWYGKYPTPTKEDTYQHFHELSKDYFWKQEGLFLKRNKHIGWEECDNLWNKAYASRI